MLFSSSTVKKIFSYLVPQVIEVAESPLSGSLEITYENGRLVMNTKRSNYSYGSLQRVFEIAFRKAPPPWDSISDVLLLGMGGGCLVDVLSAQTGFKAEITAVEADPIAVELGSRYFPEQYGHVNLVQANALQFSRETSASFDLIIVDLFVDNQLTPGCLEPGFLKALADILNPGGSIYHNLMLEEPLLKPVMSNYVKYFGEVKRLRALALNQVIVARG